MASTARPPLGGTITLAGLMLVACRPAAQIYLGQWRLFGSGNGEFMSSPGGHRRPFSLALRADSEGRSPSPEHKATRGGASTRLGQAQRVDAGPQSLQSRDLHSM